MQNFPEPLISTSSPDPRVDKFDGVIELVSVFLGEGFDNFILGERHRKKSFVFGSSLGVVFSRMSYSWEATYCFRDILVKKVRERAGYSWKADSGIVD